MALLDTQHSLELLQKLYAVLAFYQFFFYYYYYRGKFEREGGKIRLTGDFTASYCWQTRHIFKSRRLIRATGAIKHQ